MIGVSSLFTLHLLPLFLLLSVATVGAATFNITNRCSFTLWPGASPSGGVKLDPGDSWILNVSTGPGRVWARTGCSFDSTSNGSCQTGDCGGMLTCTGSGHPPITLAEFDINGAMGTDFFDISLTAGFNVPMDFLPVPANGQGGKGCSRGPRCAANITSVCSSKLTAPGGCMSPCNVSGACEATSDLAYFIRMCPDAYGFSQLEHYVHLPLRHQLPGRLLSTNRFFNSGTSYEFSCTYCYWANTQQLLILYQK